MPRRIFQGSFGLWMLLVFAPVVLAADGGKNDRGGQVALRTIR